MNAVGIFKNSYTVDTWPWYNHNSIEATEYGKPNLIVDLFNKI